MKSKSLGLWATTILLFIVMLVNCAQPTVAPTPAPAPTPKPAPVVDPMIGYYKDKVLTIIIASTAGSTQDLQGRLFGSYLVKSMGLTRVEVVDDAAASGMAARNSFYSNAKPDGFTMLYDPVGAMWTAWTMNESSVKYDITKFEYLGGIHKSMPGIYVHKDGPYQSIEAMQKSNKVVNFSATSRTSLLTLTQLAAHEIFGINAKVISGYSGGAGAALTAVVQGEVDGGCLNIETLDRMVANTNTKTLCLVMPSRDKNFPNVPCIGDLVDINKLSSTNKILLSAFTSDANSAMFPPGTPKEQVKFLRDKLADILNQKAFQDEAAKLIGYWSGGITGEWFQNEALATGKKKTDLEIFNSLVKKYVQ